MFDLSETIFVKGVHVKWSVLRWAEGQSFILCDPRCKLLYSQGKERVNRSIVHCWITCKCCNYMYICLIFFCTLSSFSITFFVLWFCLFLALYFAQSVSVCLGLLSWYIPQPLYSQLLYRLSDFVYTFFIQRKVP